MSAKSADWQFPPRNGGIDFVQDPSSAHFSDAPMPKLVREVLQNSLDARENGIYEPVVVKFRSTKIERQLIGATQLYKHLTACLDRAKAENHPASLIRFYENACKTLKSKTVRCLSITDSRTTGLSDSRWNALVVQEGAVQKPGVGAPGGSYGIGKNAVFNVSDIRTVFYSTRYVNGREGRVEKMQGKATLMSHPNPDNGSDDLQHIGFYAAQNREPLVTTEIHDFFRLDEPGAGVFVMGFNPRSSNWMKDIASAVIENFFDAIHQKTLIVEISSDDAESITVDHETIDQLFEGLFIKKPDAFYYYKAIRDAEVMPTPDIGKAGVLNAQVLIDSGAPRRTAYVNRNGMLITASREQKTNPIAPRGKSLWPDYAAVVTPATDAGDTWIRSMENPSHDSISSGQLLEAKQQRQANKIFADARRELREIIDKKADISKYGDTSNLDELRDYFPELDPNAEGNRDLTITPIALPNPSPPAPSPIPDPAPRPDPDPSPNPDPDPHPDPDPDPRPHPPGPPGPGPLRRAAINKQRYIPVGNTEAIISFVPDDKSDEVKLALTPTGGERRGEREEPLQIIDATVLSPDNQKISLAEGVLSLKPTASERVVIKIATNDTLGNFAVRIG